MTAPASLTPLQVQAAAAVDALDLEPVAFGLMHPYPGLTVMGTAEADQLTAAYRGWLKLCAWYPDTPLVPTLVIGDAWQAHLSDTAKYAVDCAHAFGAFAHCRPCYGHGLRQAAWQHACQRTSELFRRHFAAEIPGIERIADEQLHPEAPCCTGWSGCVLILAGPPQPEGGQAPGQARGHVGLSQPARLRRRHAAASRDRRPVPLIRPNRARPWRCPGLN